MRLINKTKEIRKILLAPGLEKARDNDYFLTWKLLQLTRGTDVAMKLSAHDLLKEMSTEQFPQFETIRRTRQKIQEFDPATRGSLYVSRQEHGRKVRRTITKSP